MKIGIVGLGFVGNTLNHFFSKSHQIECYDKYKEEYKNPENLKNCEVIFVSVPTPMDSSGGIDLSCVEDSLEKINYLYSSYPSESSEEKPLVVIRSTITPGNTRKLAKKYNLDIAFIPEFLREKHALEDFKNSNRFVIGTLESLEKQQRERGFEKLKSLFQEFVPNAEFFHVGTDTAEMIKYASNSMLATQVIMANEIYNICNSAGIEYNTVRKILSMDDRIAKNIDVPGPDGKKGFGGKCFPKDLNAITNYSRDNGYKPEFLEKVWELNKKIRNGADWEEIPGAISENNNFSGSLSEKKEKKE